MNSKQERHSHWQKWIDEQAVSGLSRKDFCQQHNLVLSQFSYYFLESQKRNQKEQSTNPCIMPINLFRTEPFSANEIKIVLPNGLQVLLPCVNNQQFKEWLEVLKRC